MRVFLFAALLAGLAAPVAAQQITPAQKSDFVTQGVPACVDSVKQNYASNPKLKGVPDAALQSYCGCQLDSISGRLTPAEYAQLNKQPPGPPPPSLQGYAQAANAKCGPLLTAGSRR